jgi:dTDP-4-amino-4,6-dideoxy-D-galactose acyltransferase
MAPVTIDEPCELLPWDTEFWGERIGRARTDRLDAAGLAAIEDWSAREGVACLYFLATVDDPATTNLAEAHAFHLVDIRLTLRHAVSARDAVRPGRAVGETEIRPCRERDIPALEAIARVSHRDSRFYADRRFPRLRCDDLYARWIAGSCTGAADAVFVAEHRGVPIGYTTCHLGGPGAGGTIGLLAVHRDAQGRGVGAALLGAALTWFEAAGVGDVRVVTQGRNCAAQRLYQRGGFVTDAVALWYHRWFVSRECR